jgi:NAD(P)-dependent dehydrogenase (short-subunit alcohol dehydrogenase family)
MFQSPTAAPENRDSGKLHDKVALITGGDSSIGRAVAIAYAAEGADVALVYLRKHDAAQETKGRVEAIGRRCLTITGDVGAEGVCQYAVQQTVEALGRLDILVNNVIEQAYHPLEEGTVAQLEGLFRLNIFAYFCMTKAALKYLKKGGVIVNTTFVMAERENAPLSDRATPTVALAAFTRALSQTLVEKGIRVNGVVPGPLWTSCRSTPFRREVEGGAGMPLKRTNHLEEVAPSYVFLASHDASSMTGQVLHLDHGRGFHV